MDEMGIDSIDVTLAGKTYRIEEPVRRRARVMIATLDGVLRRMFDAQQEGNDVLRGMIFLGAVDAALDWLYCHWEEIRKDKKHIDNTAEETEIVSAFNAVSGFICRPFGFQVAASPQPVQTSTPRAESTNCS